MLVIYCTNMHVTHVLVLYIVLYSFNYVLINTEILLVYLYEYIKNDWVMKYKKLGIILD